MLKFLVFSLFIAVVLSKSVDRLQKNLVKVPTKPFNPNATRIDRGGRIWGGKAAVDGQFPFANEIDVFVQSNAFIACTGSFLTTSWSITALHCLKVDTPEWEPIYVVYGAASRSSPIRKTVGVNSFVWWNSDARLDMAVLHHEHPIELTWNVALAQLPPISMENFKYDGYVVTQAGHGAYKDLQYQSLTIENSYCNSADKNDMCARSYTGSSSAEGGDSGSPVFIYEYGKPTLVGVLWGISGGVYHHITRVSNMIRQISDQVGLPLR